MRSRRGQSGPTMTLFAFQDVIMSVSGIMIVVMLLLSLELVTKSERPGKAVGAEVATDLQAEIAAARLARQTLAESLLAADQLIQVAAERTPQQLRREIEQAEADAEAIEADLADLATRQKQVEKEREAAAVEQFDQQPLEAELAALTIQERELVEQVTVEQRDDRPVFTLPQGERREGWLVVVAANEISVAPLGRPAVPVTFVGESRWIASRSAVSQFLAWLETLPGSSLYLLLLVRPGGIDAFDELQPALQSRGIAHGFDVVNARQRLLHPERGAAP